jgi:hypothetical protein
MSYKKDKLANINYNFEGTNEFDSNLKIITD